MHFRSGSYKKLEFYTSNLEIFQKESPYLSDANNLLQLSLEMGLKFADYARNMGEYVPNATKCNTWTEVKASHRNRSQLVALKFDDIYGVLIILAAGLTSSLIIFVAEVIVSKIIKCKK